MPILTPANIPQTSGYDQLPNIGSFSKRGEPNNNAEAHWHVNGPEPDS
jgi:hypothetical protein